MKKKFSFKISRIISSFQTCREKGSTSALAPTLSFLDRGGGGAPPPPSPAYLWMREEKWHVVSCAKGEEEEDSTTMMTGREKIDSANFEADGDGFIGTGDFFPPSFRKIAAARRKRETSIRRRRRSRKSRSKSAAARNSASSNWFSSEDEDEENDEREEEEEDDDDSSKSFSTAATEPSSRCLKVEESVAVVKESADPRGDFRLSMAEMVAEKGIYDAAGLEELLHCFLELNASRHHGAIVAAFADVWEALFPDNFRRVN